MQFFLYFRNRKFLSMFIANKIYKRLITSKFTPPAKFVEGVYFAVFS